MKHSVLDRLFVFFLKPIYPQTSHPAGVFMTKVQLVVVGILASLVSFLNACQSAKRNDNTYQRRDDSSPLVDEKYSLQADRDKLEQYRGEVPEDRRRENDEMAFVLQLFQEVKRPPAEIRSKFDTALRKKRELFNKDTKKEREGFTKDERRLREDFLKNQKIARDSFMKDKPGKDSRDRFFQEQDENRKEFFANEREKRGDFESDMRERRKSFEDYAREKQNDFNQEYRAYSKRYEEWKRNKENSRPLEASPSASHLNPEAAELERELSEIASRRGTRLESGE